MNKFERIVWEWTGGRPNASPKKSLYTIANTEQFEKQRQQAELKRQEFYELNQLKRGKSGGNREKKQVQKRD